MSETMVLLMLGLRIVDAAARNLRLGRAAVTDEELDDLFMAPGLDMDERIRQRLREHAAAGSPGGS